MHKSLYLLLYCLNIYMGKEKRGIQSKNNKNLNWTTRYTALCTCTWNCMYVSILLLVTLNCYYELFYMNCNIVYFCEWTLMNISNILTSKQVF